MTVRDIQLAVVRRINPHSAIPNGIIFRPYESDLVLLTRSDYLVEVEIKLSLSDFKADFKKQHYEGRGVYQKKHDWLLTGQDAPSMFYFAFPKGLIDISLVPIHLGVIEIYSTGLGFYAEISRRPKFLHRNKVTNAQLKQMLTTMHFKWFNDRGIS